MDYSSKPVLFALLALCACQEAPRPASAPKSLLLSSLTACETTPLFDAVTEIKADELNSLIEGESPALVRRTPLWWAITRGCDPGVHLLLSAGADPNQPTDSEPASREAPLSWAAMQGRAAAVKSLLEFGADPTTTDRWSKTALFHAAASGNTEAVRLLVAAGLKATDRDHSGATPLHSGARYAEVARILIEEGADASAPTNEPRGTTPIFRVRTAHADRSVDLDAALRVLLDAGVSIDQRSKHGDTPLVAASREGDLAAVQALLRAGADTTVLGYGDQTALAAAQDGRRTTEESLREGWLRSLLWAAWPTFRKSGERELQSYSEIEALLEEHVREDAVP